MRCSKVEKICEICNKKFIVIRYRKNTAKYCSRKCQTEGNKRTQFGKNLYNWKGKNASYEVIHMWVARWFGKPNKCEKCNNDNLNHTQYNWANISGKYKREKSDWKRLCMKCHRAFDKHKIARGEKNGLAKLTEKNIKEIRRMYIPVKFGITKIAKKFNVHFSTIWQIIKRNNWKHI